MGELDEVLNQSVTIEPFASQDVNGDFTYGTGVVYKAMVQRRIKIVRTMQGVEAVSTASILMDGTVSAALNPFGRDRITLPDGTQPLIMAIEDGQDDQGNVIYVEVST